MVFVTPSQNEGYVLTPFHNTKTISKFKLYAQKFFFLPCFTSWFMFASTTSTSALCSIRIFKYWLFSIYGLWKWNLKAIYSHPELKIKPTLLSEGCWLHLQGMARALQRPQHRWQNHNKPARPWILNSKSETSGLQKQAGSNSSEHNLSLLETGCKQGKGGARRLPSQAETCE